MSVFPQHKSNGTSWQAPEDDYYGIWGDGDSTDNFLGKSTPKKNVILPGVTNREKKRLNDIRDYVEQVTGEECTIPQHIIEDVYSMYVNKDIKRRDVDNTNVVKQKIIDKVYNSFTKDVSVDSPLFSSIITRELAVYMQKVQNVLEEEQKKQEEEQGQGGPAGSCPLGSAMDQGLPSAPSGSTPSDNGEDEGEGNAPSSGGDEDEDGDEGEGLNSGGKNAGDGTEMKGDGDLTQPDEPEDELEEEQPDPDLMNQIDDILDDSSKDLDKAMRDASDKIKELEDAIDEETLKDLCHSNPDFMDEIDGIKGALRKIKVSEESIRSVLSKILNKSNTYFSKKFTTVEDSIFDSDELDDVEGFEFLHPIFRLAQINEVINKTKVYKGKIDLYLDCSSSMNERQQFDGTSIRMIDLVKGIAMVLKKMGMIDKLYFFDTKLYPIENINEFTVLAFDKSGGTDFNKVVAQCAVNGRNSVVITDGEDSVGHYIKNVFWVGVGGTRFGAKGGNRSYYGYGGRGFEEYRKNKQCVTYANNNGNGKFEYCVE